MIQKTVKLEGLAVAALSLYAYIHVGGSWWLWLLLILAPDLSMLGYLVNLRFGSYLYNLAHTYTWPIIILAVGWTFDLTALCLLGLIWIMHIGIDRLLGYGLKYPTGFKDTHLQRL